MKPTRSLLGDITTIQPLGSRQVLAKSRRQTELVTVTLPEEKKTYGVSMVFVSGTVIVVLGIYLMLEDFRSP